MRIIKLPLPSSHALQGPVIRLERGQLVLRYDHESGVGIDWAEVRFDGVIRFCFRDSSVIDDDDIMGHDYLVEETETADLEALRERRRVFLGPNEFEQRKDTDSPFKLYRLYFDDAAAIDVVARSVETSFVLPMDAPSSE